MAEQVAADSTVPAVGADVYGVDLARRGTRIVVLAGTGGNETDRHPLHFSKPRPPIGRRDAQGALPEALASVDAQRFQHVLRYESTVCATPRVDVDLGDGAGIVLVCPTQMHHSLARHGVIVPLA
jgi:hypothetical protein